MSATSTVDLTSIVAGLNAGTWKPTRVMEDEHHGVRPGDRPFDVVYIRNDGWTLGATMALATAARKVWQPQWIAAAWHRPDGRWELGHQGDTPVWLGASRVCRYGLTELPADVLFVNSEEDRQNKGRVKWGVPTPVPPIGTRVRVTMNSIGPGTVEAYFVEYGWLGVQVRLDEATDPDWHKKQTAGTWHYGLALVFAIEIAPMDGVVP